MKRIKIVYFISLLSALLNACSSDDDLNPETKKEGRYFVMSSTEKFATGEAYLSLYDSLPSGEIENVTDNTIQVDAYGRFNVIDNKWAFKKFKFTGETGIVRYSLDANGDLLTDGFISSNIAPNYFIIDATTGFYSDPDLGALEIQTFNPTSMQRTGSIDASSLFTTEDLANYDITVGARTIVASNGKLFVNADFEVKDDASEGIIAPHYTMVVFDISSGVAEKLIVHEGEVYDQGHVSTTEYPATLVIEDGTIYMSTYGLFATDDNGNIPKSCVFRINGGETDFDQDWILTGSDILGGGDDDLKVIWSIAYKNDKLYVDCSDESILPDLSNLMTNMYNVYSVDPETKNSNKITGTPPTIFGHADGNLFELNDELFYQVKNDEEGSGYYKINADDTATKVFEITDTYPRAIGYLEIQD